MFFIKLSPSFAVLYRIDYKELLFLTAIYNHLKHFPIIPQNFTKGNNIS